MSLGKRIREDFNQSILTVKKRGVEVEFSIDTLLNSLVERGINVLDAIDIAYQVKLFLSPGISTKQIIKHVNNAIKDYGYNENFYIKSETQIPIMIQLDGNKVELTFKLIKELTRKRLKHMRYTSKTFRDLVDEIHRTVIELGSFDLRENDVHKLIPGALRNIIGVNPFSKTRCVDDYAKMEKMKISIDKTWVALPTEERFILLKNYFHATFRVILLSFDFLPGHKFNSTIYQINNLITHLTSKTGETLSDSEITALSKSANMMATIAKKLPDEIEIIDWIDSIDTLKKLCDGLMSNNSIRWIVGRDQYGREIFSFASKEHIQEGGKNTVLISSALYGIELQLNEIFAKSNNSIRNIKQLDQGDGRVILIDKQEFFSVLILVEKPVSHLVRQKLQELTEFVENRFLDKIKRFRGNVTEFQKVIQQYLEINFVSIFNI